MAGRLTFGLLGPVQIRSDGQPVPAGPPRQRAVLAALLLHVNRITPVDDIVDLLWGDEPPRTARKNVQLHVWRLRQLVGDRLASDPPGYRITVDPDDLDVSRFDILLESARAAVRAGPTGRAATLYRSALDLWRGAPLADVAGLGGFGGSVAWLDRRRLSAYEEYVDVELDLGRHDEMLAVLDQLVARYPLHERFAEQQVMTLHHLGRRSEAVDAYRRYRRALADELTMEPGPVLRRLAELARQPTPPAAVPARPPATAVRELPHTAPVLVGRDRPLAALTAALTTGPRHRMPLYVVTGPAGVGKSALAVQAAHRVATAFPDGQLYVDLRGATAGVCPLPPHSALGRFLRVLGVAETAIPTDVAEASAALRSLLAGRRVLLVLDNAHDAGQVRPLIPAGDGCAVLVTSRRKLTDVDGATHLELDILAEADAVDLLRRLAGDARVDAEADTAARLVRRLGGLPLAVRIAGARLAARPAWSLATLDDRLRDEHRRLHELRQGDIAVRTSFLVSYQHLTHPLAPRLFRLVGAVDSVDVTGEVAAALLDVDLPPALDALDELVDARLLDETTAGRYAMHDLIRLFARERAAEEPEPVPTAAVHRMLAHHLERTRQALGLLRPGTRVPTVAGPSAFDDAPAALAWLSAERPNLVAGVVQAARAEATARAGVDLADSLFLFFEMRGHVDDWITVDRAGVAAAERLGDPVAQARLLHDLAVAHFHRNRTDEATHLLRRSLDLSDAAGDDEGQARALNQLGVLHGMAGAYDESAACFKRSLRLRRRLGDLRSCAATTGNIGMAYRLAGRYEESIRFCRTAVRLARRSNAPEIEANALGNLGEVQCLLGRHHSALRYLRRGLAVAGVPVNERNRGSMMGTLADAYLGAGQVDSAIRYAELAVAAMRQAEFRHGEAVALRRLGLMLCRHGDVDRGVRQLRLALAVFTDVGSPEADEVRAELRSRFGLRNDDVPTPSPGERVNRGPTPS
ncbi:AfsR/SARP family transcriptional regulator [Micromonospora sagamiensis]|uniref:DNA-binding SARP family transcriptional activator n=1 Tax=Micromonospora sagamiensis TaxID=47875 RepID=A0A562WLG0_9ACTN|nr:BTAD domain-containing putative transcriptional regulator [Micromonospora sagamiensis]TWJ30891.1 DNA-binding SARP family transcriptional activator [Micromonospora sagamiensis]BCL16070.1 SARP family transcriptional regulator [Micromonospora sagamiensis]